MILMGILCGSLARFISKYAPKYFPITVVFEDKASFDPNGCYGEFGPAWSFATCTRIDVSRDSCNIHQRQGCTATSCFGTGDHCLKYKIESIVNDKDSGKIRIIAHDAKQCRQGAWVVQWLQQSHIQCCRLVLLHSLLKVAFCHSPSYVLLQVLL